MNDENKRAREQLLRLADAHADDVSAATDADLLAEAKEEGLDLRAEADRLRAVVGRAVSQAGRSRMAAARAALEAYRRTPGTVTGARVPTAANDARAITLAARNGKGQSERDERTLQEDLDELVALEARAKEPR